MTSKRTGPHVKHCQQIALPLSSKNKEDSEMIPCLPPPPVTNKSIPSGPSPLPVIPTSDACLKPEFRSLIKPSPKKKVNTNIHPPFIKGQLGTIIFSPGFVHNCEEIPVSVSLIIHSF